MTGKMHWSGDAMPCPSVKAGKRRGLSYDGLLFSSWLECLISALSSSPVSNQSTLWDGRDRPGGGMLIGCIVLLEIMGFILRRDTWNITRCLLITWYLPNIGMFAISLEMSLGIHCFTAKTTSLYCPTPLLDHCKGCLTVMDTFFEDSSWQYWLFSGILDSYFNFYPRLLGSRSNPIRIVDTMSRM